MTTRAAKPASKQAQPRKAVAARKAPSRSTPASVDVDLDAIENDVHPSFTFKLGGQTFRCRNRDDLHWDTIEKWMIERATGDANKIAVVIDDFYRAVLFPEDVEAFLALKADPKRTAHRCPAEHAAAGDQCSRARYGCGRGPYECALILSRWIAENRLYLEGKVGRETGRTLGSLSAHTVLGIAYSILWDRAASRGQEAIESLNDTLGIGLEEFDESPHTTNVTELAAWLAHANELAGTAGKA